MNAPAPTGTFSADSSGQIDGQVRFDWTLSEARALHDLPLFEQVERARAGHTRLHQENEVQLRTLIHGKPGGCPEK